MSSKSERIIFSWREDDFVYFAEQFEDFTNLFKIGKVSTGDAVNEDETRGEEKDFNVQICSSAG